MNATNDGPFELLSPYSPADGVYQGIWGGYVCDIVTPDGMVRFKTTQGIRTPTCQAEVTIRGGKATVETKLRTSAATETKT